MAAAFLTPIAVRLRLVRNSTLLMNAFYLMLATFVVAVSGFLFWILIAHAYQTAAVGLATTLLSVSGLVALLGLAGFDTTFVRFLPGLDHRNDYINSGLIVVTVISAGLAVCVAVALPMISQRLAILHSPGAFISFVFFTVVTALNVLTNAVFLAAKQARYIFIINVLFSGFKVGLAGVVARGDAMTIFALAGGAQLVGLVLSIAWMKRRLGYTFSFLLDMNALRIVRRFSFSVYSASIFNLLPPTLLPLIIIYHTGPKDAAYYYMAFTIAGVLYTIAYASMQSAFAESSHNEVAMYAHVMKAAKLIAVILVPTALLITLLSSLLLAAFGREYAGNATTLLQLFALSALPVAAYSALGAIFKVTKNLSGVVSMNVVYAAVILGFSYLLVPHLGLIAVGWSWLIGNVSACGIGAYFLIKTNKKVLGG